MTSLLDPRYAIPALHLIASPRLVLIPPLTLGALLTLSGLDPVAGHQPTFIFTTQRSPSSGSGLLHAFLSHTPIC